MDDSVGSKIIDWPLEAPLDRSSVATRIKSVICVFRAIDAGELLAPVPECDVARDHFKTALGLLNLAESELLSLYGELVD